MAPSKFDFFMGFFFLPLHRCKVSKFQQAVLPVGTEVKMRQSSCWIAFVVGFKFSFMWLFNLRGTDVLYY